jgi:protein arginine N-methyltransferase 1
MNKDSKVSALITWFDCHFENLKNKVVLSTSPFKPYTHWKNTLFYLQDAQLLREGESLKGSIAVR